MAVALFLIILLLDTLVLTSTSPLLWSQWPKEFDCHLLGLSLKKSTLMEWGIDYKLLSWVITYFATHCLSLPECFTCSSCIFRRTRRFWCDKKWGHKQTKCKTHIYWMANILFEFHTGLSQWPPKFRPKTSKEIAFFIIERLEVSKGSYHFNLTLLSPLASLLKVFRPTWIQDHIGFPREL
jgi:hypothetical protein